MTEDLQSGTNKHKARSPLESVAKRGKPDRVDNQPLVLAPQPAGFHTNMVSTVDSLATMTSTGYFRSPSIDNAMLVDTNEAQEVPMNETRDFRFHNVASQHDFNSWDGPIEDLWDLFPPDMNQSIGMTQNFAPENSFDFCERTQLYRDFLEDCCKPADFLAIRKTSGR